MDRIDGIFDYTGPVGHFTAFMEDFCGFSSYLYKKSSEGMPIYLLSFTFKRANDAEKFFAVARVEFLTTIKKVKLFEDNIDKLR